MLERFLKKHPETGNKNETVKIMVEEVLGGIEKWLYKSEELFFQYIQWVIFFLKRLDFSQKFLIDLIEELKRRFKDNKEIFSRVILIEQKVMEENLIKEDSNNNYKESEADFDQSYYLFPLAFKIAQFHKQFCPESEEETKLLQRDLVTDCTDYLSYYKEAVMMNSEQLFLHYINWVQSLFSNRGIEKKSLVYLLISINYILYSEPNSVLNKNFNLWNKAIRELLKDQTSHSLRKVVLNSDARQYLDYLLEGKREAASNFIIEKFQNGMSIKSIYMDIFKQSQYQLGVLWENNEINEAQEHFCTATTQLIMARLYPYIFKGNRKGKKKVIATCVSNELHEIGIRMVADLLELGGWDTYFVGANVPASAIIKTIEEQKAEIVAISITIIPHLHELRTLIQTIRKECQYPVRIIVGGYPFIIDEELWRKVGADGFANSADKINDVALKLVA